MLSAHEIVSDDKEWKKHMLRLTGDIKDNIKEYKKKETTKLDDIAKFFNVDFYKKKNHGRKNSKRFNRK